MDRLHSYLLAGLSIDSSLNIASSGLNQKKKKIIEKIRDDVISGMTLSQCLERYIGLPEVCLGLIRNGERTGSLAQSLGMASMNMDKNEEMKKKIISSMIYPVVILTFSSLMIVGIVKFILPQIIPMLTGMNVDLPLPTRILILSSNFATHYGLIAIITIVAIVSIFIILYRKKLKFKRSIHIFVSYIPLIGKLIISFSLAQFLYAMGSLIKSGVSSSIAYSESLENITFIPLKDYFRSKSSIIMEGKSYESVFSWNKLPAFIAPLIASGQSSGSLAESLQKASSIIESDMDNLLKRTTSLIEPAMMIFIGGFVGTIALSLIMPIYDLSKSING